MKGNSVSPIRFGKTFCFGKTCRFSEKFHFSKIFRFWGTPIDDSLLSARLFGSSSEADTFYLAILERKKLRNNIIAISFRLNKPLYFLYSNIYLNNCNLFLIFLIVFDFPCKKAC
jgi:hypothetical protein